MKTYSVVAVLILLVVASLGFAQQPQSESAAIPPAVEVSPDRAISPAEAQLVAQVTQPVTTSTSAETGTVAVPFEAKVDLPVRAQLQEGRTSKLIVNWDRPLTPEERKFLASAPNERDTSGQSIRQLIEETFRAGVAHAASAPYYGYKDDNCTVYDYAYYCRLHEPADADKTVVGHIDTTATGIVRGTIDVPKVTQTIVRQETIYQPTRETVREVIVREPAPSPPPPPPIALLTVMPWQAPPTAPVGAPGATMIYGQPAFLGGGFSYNAGTRISLSNNSGSSSQGGAGGQGGNSWSNATGGAGGNSWSGATGGAGGNSWSGAYAQGGNAWQSQGQGQYQGQGQTSYNSLSNYNQNTNNNTLLGGDQTTNVGVSTNTGVAVN